MIEILSLLLGFIICFVLYKNKANSGGIFFVLVCIIILNSYITIINFPLKMPVSRWCTFAFFFIQLYCFKSRLYRNFYYFPLKIIIIICAISSLLIGILDPRLSLFNKIYEPFREITETFFLVFVGFLGISKRGDLLRFRKPFLWVLTIITIYGLYNYIFKTNPYYEFVIQNYFKGGEADTNTRLNVLNYNEAYRYRATSTFNLSFNYGYVSALFALFFLFCVSTTKKYNKLFICGIILGLIGAVLCASRTVLLACLVSLLVYLLLNYSLNRLVKLSLMGLVFLFLAYIFIPAVSQSLDNTLSIFSNDDQVAGSSLSMRESQMLGTLKYFSQNPILGNGYGYINKELGWGDRDNASLDDDMKGFESIVFQLLIEQGLLGLITKILLIISLYYFFFKNIKEHKSLAAFGISLVTYFLIFTVGTGALGAWPITMIFLGILIKTIKIPRTFKGDNRHNFQSFI